MSLEDDANIDHLSQLCRIRFLEENKPKLQENLKKVLGYAQLLDEVDTAKVAPCTHILETMVNIFGEDTLKEMLDRNEMLKNAPDQVGGMIKTPPVIQFEE